MTSAGTIMEVHCQAPFCYLGKGQQSWLLARCLVQTLQFEHGVKTLTVGVERIQVGLVLQDVGLERERGGEERGRDVRKGERERDGRRKERGGMEREGEAVKSVSSKNTGLITVTK